MSNNTTYAIDPNSLAPQDSEIRTKAQLRVEARVADMEARFLEVSDLEGDLSTFPITQRNNLHFGNLQVATNKAKSTAHGEVFTPLWLVDQMIEDGIRGGLPFENHTTRDLCAGYGQFTIRLIRYMVNHMHSSGKIFDLDKFLSTTHSFVEYQPNSCFRLLYIFGTGIRLCMGDAANLRTLPSKARSGTWVELPGSKECWTDGAYRKNNRNASTVLDLYHQCLSSTTGNHSTMASRADLFESGIVKMRAEAWNSKEN